MEISSKKMYKWSVKYVKKCSKIISRGYANQNNNEMTFHTHSRDCHLKTR